MHAKFIYVTLPTTFNVLIITKTGNILATGHATSKNKQQMCNTGKQLIWVQ